MNKFPYIKITRIKNKPCGNLSCKNKATKRFTKVFSERPYVSVAFNFCDEHHNDHKEHLKGGLF